MDVIKNSIHTKIEYSWIGCELEVGTPIITFAAEVRFKFRDQIRKPQLKLHGAMFLKNVKIEIEFFRPAKKRALGGKFPFFSKKKTFSDAEFIGDVIFAIRHNIQ